MAALVKICEGGYLDTNQRVCLSLYSFVGIALTLFQSAEVGRESTAEQERREGSILNF